MSVSARSVKIEPQPQGERAIVRTVKIVSGRRPRIDVFVPTVH
ncbi:hypothetical protein [Allorhizocola rhizosphaerae]|nr:hypothetical protein [Allorhizocola rhizosphaerae]